MHSDTHFFISGGAKPISKSIPSFLSQQSIQTDQQSPERLFAVVLNMRRTSETRRAMIVRSR